MAVVVAVLACVGAIGLPASLYLAVRLIRATGVIGDLRVKAEGDEYALSVVRAEREAAKGQVARDAKTIARMAQAVKEMEEHYAEMAIYLPLAQRDQLRKRLDRLLSPAPDRGASAGTGPMPGVAAGAIDPAH